MMILSQLSVSGTTGQFSRQGQVFITRLKRYKVILQYNSQGLGHVGKESSKRDQFELKISVCLALWTHIVQHHAVFAKSTSPN